MVKIERVLRGTDDDVPAHVFKVEVTVYDPEIIRASVLQLRDKYYKLNPERIGHQVKGSERIVIINPPPTRKGQYYILLSIPKKYYENDEWMMNLVVDLVVAVNNNLLHYGD